MVRFRNFGLLTKTTVITLVILAGFFAIATYSSYRQHKALIIQEAVQKARIIAFEAIRGREYLSQQLKEGNVTLSRQRYGLIPVVASNGIAQLVAADLDYRIRQISDRYRNPRNAPDPFEARMLQRFYANPDLVEVYDVTESGGDQAFRYLRAFTADASCLECHGDPQDAPQFIRDIFPVAQDRSYHYRVGEVIGAASVTIPMAQLRQQLHAKVSYEALHTGGMFLALITCLGILLRVAVTSPLARLGTAIREIMHTDSFDETIPRRGRDEIGVLIDGFNKMLGYLKEKTDHLEESERRYRLLTETANDAIISFLANGQIILFNRQAERLFGFGKTEILGESIERIIHEDFQLLHELGAEEFLAREGENLTLKPYRLPGRGRKGEAIPLDVTFSVAESDGHRFFTAIIRPHKSA